VSGQSKVPGYVVEAFRQAGEAAQQAIARGDMSPENTETLRVEINTETGEVDAKVEDTPPFPGIGRGLPPAAFLGMLGALGGMMGGLPPFANPGAGDGMTYRDAPEWMREIIREKIATPATVADCVEQIRATNGDEAELVLGVERHDPCCPMGAKDGLIVSVPSVAWRDGTAHGDGVDETWTIFVHAIDAHTDDGMMVKMDVESLKTHVNHCMQAIALLEARAAS